MNRLARRTDAMFERGLVEEVRALLGGGLRDGVTASRALGYAQVIAALDAGGGAELTARRARADVRGHPPLRATAALVVSPRPPGALAGVADARRTLVDGGIAGVAARILNR